jgi:O-antigen biosynthesis protein WbqP
VKKHVIFSVQVILKRLIDILLSFVGLTLLAVPFALIALAIKLDSKGPVFFDRSGWG